MSSRVGRGYDSVVESSSGELLRDIEAISRALYLTKPPSRALISHSDAGIRGFPVSKSNSRSMFFREELLRDKKLSIWNWKPLKSLTHIWNYRFNCCFFLHVHSIEGLEPSFNNASLCVHWKRKEGLQTQPSRVCQGAAEFEETLMHQCSVYGSRNGPNNSAKYEAKRFLLYASVIEAPELDIGKHWIDLTGLLPLTFMELEDDKSMGKWTTSFKLSGKAKGATLNVSFGFLVTGDESAQLTNRMNIPQLLNLSQKRLSSIKPIEALGHDDGDGGIRNVSNHGLHFPSQSIDVKGLDKILPNSGLGLSKSLNYLYEKLEEGILDSSPNLDFFSEHTEPQNPKSDSFSESTKEFIGNECDDIEFTIIDRGIELSTKEHLKLKDDAAQILDGVAVETSPVAGIIDSNNVAFGDETQFSSEDEMYRTNNDEVVVDNCEYIRNNMCTKETSLEELPSAHHDLSVSKSIDFPQAMREFLEQENNVEVTSNFKACNMAKPSSLDEVTESVASDFLNMLEIEQGPLCLSLERDPESPRERLLREFEKDVLASGNFIFDFEAKEELLEFTCASLTGSGLEKISEDFDFPSVIHVAEKEHKLGSQSLKSKRNLKLLEDLETKALMRDWGLNEEVFRCSPRFNSGGFGSPIHPSPQKPLGLPPLGEGLGPFVQANRGGFFRSMNPSLFTNAKNGASLIMQASNLVVLPANMGSGIMEILQHLASVGIEKLSMQANKLMPLEDITGKKMQQVVGGAVPRREVPERQAQVQHKSEIAQDSFIWGKMEWFLPAPDYEDPNLGVIGDELDSDSVSLENLAPLAMEKIEALSIEGLRVPSGMSSEEAPSCLSANSLGEARAFDRKNANIDGSFSLKAAAGLQLLAIKCNGNDADELLDLSIEVDEWVKLDAGIVGGDHISDRISKILLAHNAKNIDPISGKLIRDGAWDEAFSGTCGLLENSITIAFMLQLRDPFRNYEPIGSQMLAIIQVERAFGTVNPKACSMVKETQSGMSVKEERNDSKIEKRDDEHVSSPQFNITEVHLAGLNGDRGKKLWGTTTQQRSASRWLLASGMGKTFRHPISKSKAIVKLSSPLMTKMQNGDFMWSISSSPHALATKGKLFGTSNLHIRNPDVIFPSETIS